MKSERWNIHASYSIKASFCLIPVEIRGSLLLIFTLDIEVAGD
jgi:hypothetical protein